MPNGAAAGAAGQRWYTAQGDFTPGLRSIPLTIYETTGGMFDTPTPRRPENGGGGHRDDDIPELFGGDVQLQLHRRQQQRPNRNDRLEPRRTRAARVHGVN